ncbi:MAG: metal-dependent hydrolase [Flavobacteriales bacterium CG_4_10_14_0_2_um_filter_32_8]|nr:MAG: metal-dependent hydrolase [Flavobacteriales bacterium CG_4_10_14_0_2_um_filter_32_8]PJB14055.1 MAG: metal-dependent hydrolase [Flavobacteriales bacterium CG_4_9_14_3_um_filter_32_8]
MRAEIQYNNHNYKIDISKPLDISIPLKADKSNVTAYYVDVPKFEPVMANGFVGAVHLGGSVNFNNIFFNPHGNGTHTECVGHISKEKYTINQCLKEFFFLANVVSVTPIQIGNDAVITLEQIQKVWQKNSLPQPFGGVKAFVIRTLPNKLNKLTKQYTNQNSAYIDYRAVQFLIDNGVEHLLIDSPSIDKEEDGGALLAHRTFWEYPKNTQSQRTVTELIFVPNHIKDGTYFLNIQIASFENDASPSKPILYAILS